VKIKLLIDAYYLHNFIMAPEVAIAVSTVIVYGLSGLGFITGSERFFSSQHPDKLGVHPVSNSVDNGGTADGE
jgi:hypothetical protein